MTLTTPNTSVEDPIEYLDTRIDHAAWVVTQSRGLLAQSLACEHHLRTERLLLMAQIVPALPESLNNTTDRLALTTGNPSVCPDDLVWCQDNLFRPVEGLEYNGGTVRLFLGDPVDVDGIPQDGDKLTLDVSAALPVYIRVGF